MENISKNIINKVKEWHRTKSILSASKICQALYNEIVKKEGGDMSIDTQERESYERKAPKAPKAPEQDIESA